MLLANLVIILSYYILMKSIIWISYNKVMIFMKNIDGQTHNFKVHMGSFFSNDMGV